VRRVSGRAIDVPAEVRGKAATHGAAGARWLRELPAVLDALAREWGLAVGAGLHGGSDSYVAEAVTRTGDPAVLKILLPGDGGHVLETLRLAGGQGYVRLLAADEGRRAMLLERLGPSLDSLGLPVRDQVEVLCATLRRAWVVPAEPGFMSGERKAIWLAGFIADTWRALDRPCTEQTVDRALAFASARAAAHDPRDAVLVHGDAHNANALVVPGRTAEFKLIDPDGLFAERACDLAVPMREWSGELLRSGDPAGAARDRCALLSRLTGVAPRPIWEWGFMERVSSGLLLLQVGREEEGAEMLAVADALAAAPPAV
jgi:streptomycin 6-kinase